MSNRSQRRKRPTAAPDDQGVLTPRFQADPTGEPLFRLLAAMVEGGGAPPHESVFDAIYGSPADAKVTAGMLCAVTGVAVQVVAASLEIEPREALDLIWSTCGSVVTS